MGTAREKGRFGFVPVTEGSSGASPPPRHRRSIAWLALAAVGLALMLLGAQWARRAFDTVLVLTDIGAGTGPSLLKELPGPPVRAAVRYPGNGGVLEADLYLPGQGPPRAGVVLVPGVVPLGNRDPRLVAFAQTLARAGFAVLAPQMPGYQKLQVRPTDIGVVAAAFRFLAAHPRWTPQGRAGMVAFSYAVGFAVLAGLQPDIRNQVRFIVGIGGYYDLNDVVTYATTGYFQMDGRWVLRQPDSYGKWVFLESSRPYLDSANDRSLLGEMARMKLENPHADIAPLTQRLGPEGASVYRLLANTDPAKAPARIAALPKPIRAVMDALTLNNKNLHTLHARLILVAGEDDGIVPYDQSLRLARAVPPGHARVFIIHRVLGHVELRIARVFRWSFWREDLPDVQRLYAAIHLLLAEQQARRPLP